MRNAGRVTPRWVKEAGVALIRRIIYRLSVPLLPHTREDAFQLAMFFVGDEQQFFVKTRAALKLIRDNDPRRYARLKKDLRRIALVKAGESSTTLASGPT